MCLRDTQKENYFFQTDQLRVAIKTGNTTSCTLHAAHRGGRRCTNIAGRGLCTAWYTKLTGIQLKWRSRLIRGSDSYGKEDASLQWMAEALGVKVTGRRGKCWLAVKLATAVWRGGGWVVVDKPCTCILHLRGRKTERASVATDWPISGGRQSLVLRWGGRGA